MLDACWKLLRLHLDCKYIACKLLVVVCDHIEPYPSSVAVEDKILARDGPGWGPMADRVLASGGAKKLLRVCWGLSERHSSCR